MVTQQDIRTRRVLVGLSRAQIARLAQIPMRQFERIEYGRRKMRPDEAERITRVLTAYEQVNMQLAAAGSGAAA